MTKAIAMGNYELVKLEKAPSCSRWMVKYNGLAYAGFSTKKVALQAMTHYFESDEKEK